MPYNTNSTLWPNTTDNFFKDKHLNAIQQEGPHCVSTALAILSGTDPRHFQGTINTQDPVSWSDALKGFHMKLAYCPSDVRKLKHYLPELIEHDDLFLLCYYMANDDDILGDPDDDGWICSSHVVVLHKDQIFDPLRGYQVDALNHSCSDYHTKRIFRIVPLDNPRGL
jgi:hypothetical protein